MFLRQILSTSSASLPSSEQGAKSDRNKRRQDSDETDSRAVESTVRCVREKKQRHRDEQRTATHSAHPALKSHKNHCSFNFARLVVVGKALTRPRKASPRNAQEKRQPTFCVASATCKVKLIPDKGAESGAVVLPKQTVWWTILSAFCPPECHLWNISHT